MAAVASKGRRVKSEPMEHGQTDDLNDQLPASLLTPRSERHGMTTRPHWENVYGTKAANEVSWYLPHLETSLALIRTYAPHIDSAVIDIGGGEATLVDDLLLAGRTDVTVLDISQKALDVTKARLGPQASKVNWIVGDITEIHLEPARYDLWHDRAVFHFLTTEQARTAYAQQVARALKPGGHVIVASFGPEGPLKCSGLDIVRYDPVSLHAAFGEGFELVHSATEIHMTPWGSPQQFIYCVMRHQ